jgi:hypothetical protein
MPMDSKQQAAGTEERKEQKQRRPYEKPSVEYVALTPEERLMACGTPSNLFTCDASS